MVEPPPLIAVDVGNGRIKIGLFRTAPSGAGLPEPERTLCLDGPAPPLDGLVPWLGAESGRWHIASVNRPASTRLVDWLRERRSKEAVVLLAAGDLPLQVNVPRPDMVGVDRLLDAVAANQLRQPGRPAVVVDVGSAITVDLISPRGAFMGGAILPGIAMSARALHEFTDLLPEITISELHEPPALPGTATEAAIRAGLLWGAVGAIRQLVEKLTPREPSQVFLTGGAGPAVAKLLGPRSCYLPHLTLAGIALAAASTRD